MLNLRSVDLNLLPVFEAVYEARSLSRAALRLAMTQSAVSHALARLRTVFRDELFIRQARGVLPTPVADVIYGRLRGSLASVRESISEMQVFDPKTSARKFFVGIMHPLGPLMAVRLQERLARAAPGIEVAFTTRSRPIGLEQAIREGRMDAVVDWIPLAGEKFSEVALFDDALTIVARRDNPAVSRIRSIRDLKDWPLVSLRPRIEGEHPVPGMREWQRLELELALEVSELLDVFMVASRSDMLGLVPRSMIAFARDTFGLAPIAVGPRASVPIRLIWHAGRKADAAHAFLRQQIALASADVVPTEPKLPQRVARRETATSR